jgi:predicted Zn-dependent peptidase
MTHAGFHQHQLDNGLTILGEDSPAAHSFAAGLFVFTGSRDESPTLNGVSHFLEHMMFKGSARLDWQAMNRVFDEMGARYNAFTTQEMTAYYGNVLPQFTDKLLGHLRELFEPAIRKEDFDTEKKVILEEIAMYEDEPSQRVYEKLMEAHFNPHPLGMSIIGTPPIITAMTHEQMAAYFKEHYVPPNMVLSVAGRFDFAEVCARANELMGHWKGEKSKRSYPRVEPKGQRVNLVDAKLSRAYVMGMTPGPSSQDEDRFAARVLADILGDAEGSRFYWALVDNALCEDADFGFYPHDHCGSFYLSLQTDAEKVEPALEIAMKELRRIHEDLTDDEVTRARNKLASSITIGSESPMGRMRANGSNWLYTGEYRSVADDMRTLESISRKSVLTLLEKYRFDPMTIVSLGPSNEAGGQEAVGSEASIKAT